MALKTNFTDDILSESMNGKRQYNVTENSNGQNLWKMLLIINLLEALSLQRT